MKCFLCEVRGASYVFSISDKISYMLCEHCSNEGYDDTLKKINNKKRHIKKRGK